jgi:hypothetical protein
MLLDTDVLIDLERRHPGADAWFGGLAIIPDIPGFAAMELLNGCRSKAEWLNFTSTPEHPFDAGPGSQQQGQVGPTASRIHRDTR